jgi:alcohol dehydrogenase (cytochrome c)
MTGSYDAALNLVYWGTGNASGDFSDADRDPDPESSKGAGREENLYTASLVALDADTGQLKW